MNNCKFCQKPIAEHEAGRCLDALVHSAKGNEILEYVFSDNTYIPFGDRFTPSKTSKPLWIQGTIAREVPHYSEDLNHAIKLWNPSWRILQDNEGTWYISKIEDSGDELMNFSEGETLALALVRAYLIEKMKEEGK